ncbi:hypothetical protein [Microcoleus sp. D3_18a_C4]|uniref:hypothetical protein n=1 Tax=unclassified Microcoleus TaxID=2642155 RepID=UPI002FD717CF
MKVTQATALVKYVADANGNKTDVLVPLEVWEALLASWKEMIDRLEDREDIGIFQEWMQQRDAGQVETISLEDLEQELIADGLV